MRSPAARPGLAHPSQARPHRNATSARRPDGSATGNNAPGTNFKLTSNLLSHCSNRKKRCYNHYTAIDEAHLFAEHLQQWKDHRNYHRPTTLWRDPPGDENPSALIKGMKGF